MIRVWAILAFLTMLTGCSSPRGGSDYYPGYGPAGNYPGGNTSGIEGGGTVEPQQKYPR